MNPGRAGLRPRMLGRRDTPLGVQTGESARGYRHGPKRRWPPGRPGYAAQRIASRPGYLCFAMMRAVFRFCGGQGVGPRVVGLRAAVFVTFPRKRFVHDFTSRSNRTRPSRASFYAGRGRGLPLVLVAVHRFRAVPGVAGGPERVVGPLPGGPRARARLPEVAGVAAALAAMLPARSARSARR